MLTKIEFTNIKIESIEFKDGVNLIYGDKVTNAASSNSLGKTMLIEIIDHLLGASDTKNFDYNELINVSVVGTFQFNNNAVIISRPLVQHNIKEKNVISIIKNNMPILNKGETGEITLTTWLQFLKIWYIRNNEISFRQNNSMYFKKDKMDDFRESTKIFPSDTLWERGKCQSYFLNLDYTLVSSVKHYSSKEKAVLKTLSPSLKKILTKKEELVENFDNLESEYIEVFEELKHINSIKRIYASKKRILEKNIKEIRNTKNQSYNIQYDIYKAELANFLIKNYEESKNFHEQLLTDNEQLIYNEITSLSLKIKDCEEKVRSLHERQNVIVKKRNEYQQIDVRQDALKHLLADTLDNSDIAQIANEVDKELNITYRNDLDKMLFSKMIKL